MKPSTTEPHPFITYLESLREDRGALAALRRGLGQPPGRAPEMYRYVVPRLPKNADYWTEATCYLVAALFAHHPESSSLGNFGHHFAATCDPQGDNQAIERRFTALLNTHPEDLHLYLRQAVSFLKSREKPINWHQLLRDLRYWRNENRSVQKAWAYAFWRVPDQTNPDQGE